MISLAVRHKVPLTEDALTAAVLDYLRSRPDVDELRALLERVRPFKKSARPHFIFDRCSIDLWPKEHRAGEPDALIVLAEQDTTVGRIVVEAKLGAPKSGTGDVDGDRRFGDQLARYLLAEAEDYSETPTYLLYLTHHIACPVKDLTESAHALSKANRPDLVPHLLWLPWHEFAKVLSYSIPSPLLPDVRELLGRVAIHRFDRIELVPLPPLGPARLYRSKYRTPQTVRAYPSVGNRLQLSIGEFFWRYRRGRPRAYSWLSSLPTTTPAEFYRKDIP